VTEHAPIRGFEDAVGQLHLPPERLLKTIVFRASAGGFVLAALAAARHLSYGGLARAAGVPRAQLRQATADDMGLLGMEPGGASPVCGAGGVTVVFDHDVSAMGRVYCGSGRADRTVEVEAGELLRLVRPIVARISAESAAATS
jgi:Cys-tRNA(Pro)/Cys-tRNA(Cys) deacylase